MAAGVVIVVTVGVGRVALNVHHLSDVIAGWALGYVLLRVVPVDTAGCAELTEADERPAVPDTGR